MLKGRYAVLTGEGQEPSARIVAARDLKLDRRVTLWRPAAHTAGALTREGAARFIAGGHAWARLGHPAVACVHEIYTGADPLIVSAPVDPRSAGRHLLAWGQDLAADRAPSAEGRRWRLLVALAEALAMAHSQDLIVGVPLLSWAQHIRVLPGDLLRLGGFTLAGGAEGKAADVAALEAFAWSLMTGAAPDQADLRGADLYGADLYGAEADSSLDLPLSQVALMQILAAPEGAPALDAAALAQRLRQAAGAVAPAIHVPKKTPPGPLRVHIVDAALQRGPITDRPTATLFEQCAEAAEAALSAPRRRPLRDEIDAVYLGTMGLPGPLHPTHIPNALRARLGLEGIRGDGYHVHMSTSESGAVALLKAVRDLQAGRRRTVLVVAGEAMFSGDPDARRGERAAINRWIKSVVDPSEGAYDLSMLNIGDLLMDHLIGQSGLPPDEWRATLAGLTLGKYQRAQRFPQAMQTAKGRPLTAEAYQDPAQNRPVTPHYRMHDVCPNANGATAVVLSVDPALASGVQILGVGAGHTKVALTQRSGPLARPAAVRRAFRQLCHEAQVSPELLRDDRHTTAIFHDAFPAVELAALCELHPEASWAWRLARLRRGWTNPLGGLSAAGHALGNSGLLQVALAFHMHKGGGRLLRAGPEGTPFTVITSVGAALTNVIATLVGRADSEAGAAALQEARARYDEGEINALWRRPALAPALQATLDGLAPGEGVVIARTRVHGDPHWVYFVRQPAGATLAVMAGDPLPHGARVQVREGAPRCLTPLD